MSSKRKSSIHKIRDIQLNVINLEDQYELIKIISSGEFGKILLAVHKNTEMQIVLKGVRKNSTSIKDFLAEFHYSYFLSPHNNVLDTYDVTFESKDHYYFAQEASPFGDLRQYVENTGGIDEKEVKMIVQQVCSALDFMHSKDLVHRDVRAENILIFQPDFSRIKLTDFAMTRRAGTLVKKRTRCLPTCPPEIWEAVHLEGYTIEIGSDVWQIGILIYFTLMGKFPWQKADITDSHFTEFIHWQKRKTTRTPKDFKRFTARLHRLFRRLMDAKPSKRYPVTETNKYLQDKWVMCRSPRTSKIADCDNKDDRLGELLSNFGLETRINKDVKEQRIQEWILSSGQEPHTC